MNQVITNAKQSIKEAGYKYLYFNQETKSHVLIDNSTGIKANFFANKNHASWGLIYKNTHLEFAFSLPQFN